MAIQLDGTYDYVQTPISGIPAANAAQSISAWFWYSALPTTIQNIIAFGIDASSSSVQLGFRNYGAGEVITVWKYGGTNLVSGALPAINTWHHAAYTFDATTHRLYVDGVEVSNSIVAPTTLAPTELDIGRWITNIESFVGRLEDLRIYNRSLAADEVATIYGTQGVDGIVYGLVSRWMAEELGLSLRAS